MAPPLCWKSVTLLILLSAQTATTALTTTAASSSCFPRGEQQNGSLKSSRDNNSNNNNDPTQPRQQVSSDSYAEVVYYKPKAKPKKRKRPKPVAPVVDSKLLRFLSDQKKAASESPQSTPTQEPWLNQFNGHRVAQLLMMYDVPRKSAEAAGQKVQAYVLQRTTRRRIRDFLKKRDLEWNGKNIIMDEEATEKRPEYGFEDNVKLLKQSGLTGSDIGAILTHTPGVAMMMPTRNAETTTTMTAMTARENNDEDGGVTLEETLQRVYPQLLHETLRLRKYDARKVLRTCPGLLTGRGSKQAQDVVTILVRLGVSVSSFTREKAAVPMMLSRSASSIFRLVSFLCSDAVRMPVKSIGPLLRRKTSLELLNAAAPIRSVTEEEADSISSSGAGQTEEDRRLAVNAVYRQMSATAWALRNELGTEDLGKVVSAYPSVLLLDVETQIVPTAEFLLSHLGELEDDLPLVLQSFPSLLGIPLADIERVVNYLQDDLGVEDDALPSIIRAFPYILSMDIDKTMKPVVEFLEEIGIKNIGQFITRLPPVLGYSVENELRPKWNYLSKVCLYPSFELSTFPAYFSYPFDRVIKCRYEYLLFVKEIPTQLLALDLVLRFGNEDFATKVARDEDGGATYARFIKARRVAAKSGKTTRKAKLPDKQTGGERRKR